jgi:hypothetical protein
MPNAWLLALDNADRFDGFSAGIAGNVGAGVAPGDGLVLVRATGGIARVVAVARVFRTRRMSDATVIYFDGVRALTDPVDAQRLGLPALDAQRGIVRLDWTTLERVVKEATSIEFSALPVFHGRTLGEQAYIRELLQVSVEDDLLGPASGPAEEIVGMSVRDRYLVGKLAPRTRSEAEGIEGLQGPTAVEDRAPDGSVPPDLRPYRDQRHQPGEEFASTAGAADPDDDDAQGVDASKNQSFVPSSLGLTVCVDGAAKTLEVEARWGRYERTTSEEQTTEDGKPLRAWKRIPSGGRISLPLADGPIRPMPPDPTCPQVVVQGTVRAPLVNGDRLVTVFLVNDQPQPEQNQDEAWVFQPELILRHPDAEAVFRRRPAIGHDEPDREREALEMIYRRRVEFAVGHSVSVHAEPSPNDPERSAEVRTRVLPRHEIPVTETPGLDAGDRPAMQRLIEIGALDMRRLAELDAPELCAALAIVADDYEAWIGEQRARIGVDVVGCDETADQTMDRCRDVLERLREGIATLERDENALRAFRFANLAMAEQRVRSIYALERRRGREADLAALDRRENRSWRPFQLAFILLSLPALAEPRHADRTKPIDAYADLLWFPTGGGKTEAYLGLAAFCMAIRRLHGPLGGLDGGRGLAVIMRYTLRLLTLQQFQRATTLMCAMEALRRADAKTWGPSPFTIGLWVGQRVTPNDTEASHEAIEAERTGKRPSGSSPAQLTACPWCGSEIAPGRDIEVRRVGKDVGRTLIYCGDKLGRCEFSRAKSKDDGLPVLVVDDEIYRRPPSLLIATVDKFAMMAWRGQVRTLFGRADLECPRHGLLWPGSDCNGKHQKRGALSATDARSVARIRPPDLIIQDEFHLISGPLGTMVGLYETAVDELCAWSIDGTTVRPKVVASTATARKAAEQVNSVFLRRVAIFPPHGLDVEDNFFSVQRPLASQPGRRYLGVCSPGAARPAVLIRVYTALLTAAQALFERFGPVADPWMTVVGYFNSLRELGGMRRLAEDDVQTRSFRVQMSRVARPGLAQRAIKNVDELTSRVSSRDIPAKLDQLEVSFKGAPDPASGAWKVQWAKGETQAIDIVLATNMLSVGVDVNRLGLMVVNGQPKSTAEYIQATSRVGRFFPGLVCSVLTWSRPRDLSHYETFEHYHATFYKHVEAQSVTPFAPRAMDRGLTGAMLSWLRLERDPFNPNLGAERMDSAAKPEVVDAKKVIADRAWRVTGQNAVQSLAAAMVGERCDEWVKEATRGGRRLGYEGGRARKKGEDDVAALLRKPGMQAWELFTVPMSLREVEPAVRLIMSDDDLPEGPAWRPRPVADAQGGGGA